MKSSEDRTPRDRIWWAALFQPGSIADCTGPSQVRTPQNWFNPCAFASPAVGPTGLPLFGTEGRNVLTGPGFTNLDFGLAKSVALGSENRRLQFHGDFFNLFNHPTFDIPSHVFGASNFGKILSADAYGNKSPRQIQLSARYIF